MQLTDKPVSMGTDHASLKENFLCVCLTRITLSSDWESNTLVATIAACEMRFGGFYL